MYKVRVNHRTERTHRQATSSVYSRAQSQNRPAKTYRSGMLFPKTRILCKCNRVCFINSGRQWFLWQELGGGGGYSYSTPNTVTRSKVTANNILYRWTGTATLCAFWKIGKGFVFVYGNDLCMYTGAAVAS